MKEVLVRVIVGGGVVSAFALLGKAQKIRRLFWAAPSVGLATLVMTVMKDGEDTLTGKHYEVIDVRGLKEARKRIEDGIRATCR